MTFDEHENGQLRLGAQGDQVSLFALPAERIPVSDGSELAAPSLEAYISERASMTRAEADSEARARLSK